MDLGVHFNTVAEAYRTLAEEGWLEVSHGRAARVLERRTERQADPATVAAFRRTLKQLIAEMRSKGIPPSRIGDELRTLWEGLQ